MRGAAFLGYHSVSPEGPPFLSVPPSQFEAHLRILRQRGWANGDRAALEAFVDGRPLGGRHVFLTFDDGYRDSVTQALPRLVEYGYTASFFVLPSRLDAGGPLDWQGVEDHQRQYPDVMRSLTWEMVEQLAEANMEIGSHTVSHPRLSQIGDEELRQELLDSRREIAARLGRCDSLAYPYGDWSPRVAAAADAAGYRFAFTLPFETQEGGDRLTIPRITIDRRDAAWRFRAKMSAPGRRLFLSSAKPTLRALRSAIRRGPDRGTEDDGRQAR